MNRYRELQIKTSSPISIEALGESIDACLACFGQGWERSFPERRAGVLEEPDAWLFYRCNRRGERAAALLAIRRINDRTFYVPNVVPDEKNHHLSFEGYTSVLKSFHDAVLTKLSSEFTVVLVMESAGGGDARR